MSATTAFSGPPTRADWYLMMRLAHTQIYSDFGGSVSQLMALSPGDFYLYSPCLQGLPNMVLGQMASGINLVSMQGTGTGLQWVGNILGSGLVPSLNGTGMTGAWFTSIAWIQYHRLYPLINSGKPIVFTGHSLGGAQAILMASYAARDGLNVQGVYVAACPKVGDAAFAASLPFPVYRLENTGDPVPAVPPSVVTSWHLPWPYSKLLDVLNYAPAGEGFTLDESGILTSGSNPMSIPDVVSLLASGSSGTHLSEYYLARLRPGFGGPNDLYPGANGFSKPWLLLDLPVQPAPPVAAPGRGEAIPYAWTQPVNVRYVACDGTVSDTDTILSPPPSTELGLQGQMQGVMNQNDCIKRCSAESASLAG